MELDTRKMLSAQTKISKGFHSGAQDTAGSLLAHNNSSSSISTAITWFHPDGVLGPPCLIPTSSLKGELFVLPMHGLADRSKFSLTAAATLANVAPLSRSTSPNTWALTESNAVATSMETTNNFSPHSSALRRLSTKKETMSRHCKPGLNPTSCLGSGLSSLSRTFHKHISYTLYSVGTSEIGRQLLNFVMSPFFGTKQISNSAQLWT